MADLDEALGQDVKEKTAKEFVGRDGDRLLAASPERDAARIKGDKAAIG
jgi:hypothetical protein